MTKECIFISPLYTYHYYTIELDHLFLHIFNLYVMNKYLLHIEKCLNSGIISLWAFFQLSKRLFHLIILSNDTVDYRLIMRADDQGLILLMMKPNHNLLLMTRQQKKLWVQELETGWEFCLYYNILLYRGLLCILFLMANLEFTLL